MNRSEVITQVKALMEEFSPFDEKEELVAIPTSDVKPIEAYIDEVLDDAFDKVLLSAPLRLIKHTTIDYTSVAKTDIVTNDEVGYLEVPCDYLRIHSVIFGKWHRYVNEAISDTDPRYILQRNKYTRGRIVKPVVAINNNNFEIYSIVDGDTCSVFKYIPKTLKGVNSFEDSLCQLLGIMCASMVCEIFERFDKVNLLLKEYNNLINMTV